MSSLLLSLSLILACSSDNQLSALNAPERGSQGGEPGPRPGAGEETGGGESSGALVGQDLPQSPEVEEDVRELRYPDPAALSEGSSFHPEAPVQALRVIITADPGVDFEVRAGGDWQPLPIDWSHGDFRDGHLILDAPTETVELRSDGGMADFVQVELFYGAQILYDDDYPEGLPDEGGPSTARAQPGRWIMPYEVWEIGQQWYLPYEYATECVGGALPGTIALGDWLVANTDATSYGAYSCRDIVGGSSLSVHAAGRAIDLFIPTDGSGDDSADNDLGDPVAHYLIERAEEIGISYIIWDRSDWGAHRSGDKQGEYTGAHPHNDHLHIELTSEGANLLTPWFATEQRFEPSSFSGYVGIEATPSGRGYRLAHTDGTVDAYGDATWEGDASEWALSAPITAIADDPSTGGYWLAAEDGGVFTFGGAQYFGSLGGESLDAAIVDIAATPSGRGYWLTAEDGGVFAFGDAGYYGSMEGEPLDAPVVGIQGTADGAGYWLTAEDGGVFAFGDAGYYGSMGGQELDAPVCGIVDSGAGYWLAAEDGGVFAFGEAGFFGSMGGQGLDGAITDLAATPSGQGYWLLGGDGGIFTFGDAEFFGSSAD